MLSKRRQEPFRTVPPQSPGCPERGGAMLKMSEEAVSLEPSQSAYPPYVGQACAHLSNERVFLTWSGLGLILMGFGVTVAKMRIALSDVSHSLGSLPQSGGSGEISPVTMGMWFLGLGLFTIIM